MTVTQLSDAGSVLKYGIASHTMLGDLPSIEAYDSDLVFADAATDAYRVLFCDYYRTQKVVVTVPVGEVGRFNLTLWGQTTDWIDLAAGDKDVVAAKIQSRSRSSAPSPSRSRAARRRPTSRPGTWTSR